MPIFDFLHWNLKSFGLVLDRLDFFIELCGLAVLFFLVSLMILTITASVCQRFLAISFFGSKEENETILSFVVLRFVGLEVEAMLQHRRYSGRRRKAFLLR